jgi:predicted nucleic-acid-binding protein
MIGIDTNVLVRLLVSDEPSQVDAVHRLLAPLDDVADSVLVNDVVLAETFWTLRKVYSLVRDDIILAARGLLSAKTFRFESREALESAVRMFETSSADFSDCLVAAKSLISGCDFTASFDKGMKAWTASGCWLDVRLFGGFDNRCRAIALTVWGLRRRRTCLPASPKCRIPAGALHERDPLIPSHVCLPRTAIRRRALTKYLADASPTRFGSRSQSV